MHGSLRIFLFSETRPSLIGNKPFDGFFQLLIKTSKRISMDTTGNSLPRRRFYGSLFFIPPHKRAPLKTPAWEAILERAP